MTPVHRAIQKVHTFFVTKKKKNEPKTPSACRMLVKSFTSTIDF